MASIVLIGDSHLERCYHAALKVDKNMKFGYSNLQVSWETGFEQIKTLESRYEELIAKNGEPDAVFLMVGGYDQMLTNDAKNIANKLKTFVHRINSSTVKCVIVCSILNRRCSVQKEEEIINKGIRNANKMLAKAFRNMEKKVFFINVRPPGKVVNIIDRDKFHLKREWYDHVYKKLSVTLEERIIPQFPNVSQLANNVQEMDVSEEEEAFESFKKEPSMDNRLAEFRQILINDYKHFCSEENDLAIKFTDIQRKLEATTNEKLEVVNVYKKLFGVDLTQGNMDKNFN